MTKMLRALAGIIFFSISAHAQVPGQLPTGTVWGNAGASRAPGSPSTLTALIDRALGSTQGSMLYRNATVWTPLTPGTAGLPLLSGGAAANLAYGILTAAAGGSGINNGSFTETRAGTLSLPAVVQGDLWFGSAAGVISALAKTASASQFIKNSGTANNPAWAQPAIADISGWGTGIATALGVNVGSAGAPVLFNGAGGTPSSMTLTNATALPAAGVTGTAATLTVADQTLSGGAIVTAANLGTKSSGTTTIDCGTSPLQYLTNNGAFTLAAPANDSSCILQVTNGASAGTITFSGFTVPASANVAMTTTNTNKFMISIARVNGSSIYSVVAQQ